MVIYTDADEVISYCEEDFYSSSLQSDYPVRILSLGSLDDNALSVFGRELVLADLLDFWREAAYEATRSDSDISVDDSGYLMFRRPEVIYAAFDNGIVDLIDEYEAVV